MAANRGEIAIRIFRAANELGLRTVSIFAEEDRFSIHRFKADEAYELDSSKGPVGAYLDVEGIVALAKQKGVTMIHPGYGFLSENAQFARACAREGITFIGPSPELLENMGDKTAARTLAHRYQSAGRPDRRCISWSPGRHAGCPGRRPVPALHRTYCPRRVERKAIRPLGR